MFVMYAPELNEARRRAIAAEYAQPFDQLPRQQPAWTGIRRWLARFTEPRVQPEAPAAPVIATESGVYRVS